MITHTHCECGNSLEVEIEIISDYSQWITVKNCIYCSMKKFNEGYQAGIMFMGKAQEEIKDGG